MMHAIVSTRYNGPTNAKGRGDILSVGLTSRPIGSMEKRHHFVCEIDDEDVEARIIENNVQGLQNPYASNHDIDDPDYTPSTKYIDIEALDAATQAEIMDPDVPVDVIPWSTIQPAFKTRAD